jgi:hypothetical protein
LQKHAKRFTFTGFWATSSLHKGGFVEDAVAVDAKRILLRYGAPIAVLDSVPAEARIKLARAITRTSLPERSDRLKSLLTEEGYVEH